MGKFTTSLLSIVFQLYALNSIFADEQVRQVQEALRQRHLFYGNPTGEMSPALSAAVAHYQGKKGFPRTGTIDVETCTSLGIVRPLPVAAQTPFVVENNGAVRGANGETLPDSWPWPSDKYPIRFGLAGIEYDNFGRSLAAADIELKRNTVSRSKAGPPRTRARTRPRKEGNPIVLAFRSLDHAVKFLFGDKEQKKKRTTPKRS